MEQSIMIAIAKEIVGKLNDKFILSKIKGYEDIGGFLRPTEAIALYKIALQLPPQSVIVEIGSWKGKSTYCLAAGITTGKIIAIDPFNSSGDMASAKVYAEQAGNTSLLQQFKSNMSNLGVLKKIEILHGFSNEFVGKIPKIDLLFIDGDHSKEGCDFDFMNYVPYISKGGYIALHDFDITRKSLGPTWVVENRILPDEDNFKFLSLNDSLWIGQKK